MPELLLKPSTTVPQSRLQEAYMWSSHNTQGPPCNAAGHCATTCTTSHGVMGVWRRGEPAESAVDRTAKVLHEAIWTQMWDSHLTVTQRLVQSCLTVTYLRTVTTLTGHWSFTHCNYIELLLLLIPPHDYVLFWLYVCLYMSIYVYCAAYIPYTVLYIIYNNYMLMLH